MSEPTYRIELEHEPQWTQEPWHYYVWDIGAETLLHTGWGKTREQAMDRAQESIRSQNFKQVSSTVYATETGDLL